MFKTIGELRRLEDVKIGDVGVNGNVYTVVKQGGWRGRGRVEAFLFSFGLTFDVLNVCAAQGQRPGVAVDSEAVFFNGLLFNKNNTLKVRYY